MEIKYYAKRLKEPKVLIIIVLVIALIAIAVINPFAKTVEYEIEDKCGKLVNLFSHTINDESACRLRCRSQCESQDHSYKRFQFTRNELSCNTCKCYCKD